MSSLATKSPVKSPYPARLAKLAGPLASAGADYLLITNPIDVGYLTGFRGGDSYLLVGPKGTRPVVISDFRYWEELGPVKPIADIQIRTKSLTQTVAELLAERDITVCAVQADHITVGERDAFAKLAKGRKIIATSGLVAGLRIKKDESEIALIKKAIRIQEEALFEVLEALGDAMADNELPTEIDVAALLEFEMKSRGAGQVGFQSIVATKANGSLPHYRPTNVRLALNRPLLIDWGAVYQGYHGDMTRTFTLGKWPPKIKEIYQIVLDAQEAAADALAPGKSSHEVDAVARAYIARHGYGERFGHGLGHGMGMNAHEDPRLNPLYAPMTLEPGHVVTVEPGIYLPGVGGVRIEDDYVITEKGAKNLCSLPKDLEWATL